LHPWMPAKGAGMGETTAAALTPEASSARALELKLNDDSALAKATANNGTTVNTPASAGGKSPITPQCSCLSGNYPDGTRRPRTDSRGCIIVKGEKKHKVFFLDEVKQGARIEEVKEVKSFKNNTMGCRCSLM